MLGFCLSVKPHGSLSIYQWINITSTHPTHLEKNPTQQDLHMNAWTFLRFLSHFLCRLLSGIYHCGPQFAHLLRWGLMEPVPGELIQSGILNRARPWAHLEPARHRRMCVSMCVFFMRLYLHMPSGYWNQTGGVIVISILHLTVLPFFNICFLYVFHASDNFSVGRF